MTATFPIPMPDPEPGEVARGLADIERHLAAKAPTTPVPAPRSAPATSTLPEGETRRVQRLRAEVIEAHALAALQDDDAPLLLDTPRVRRRRKAAREAVRLHELGQDPAMRAWQAARMLRLLVSAAIVSLTLALAWSTAGVQHFAAEGATPWSPAWVFAWLVEPFMSLALLFVVGARAYLATRGQPIVSPVLGRIEKVFLALTFGMNVWPYLPWSLPEGKAFTVAGIVLHVLGPIIAVAVVTALPIVLSAFADLDHGRSGTGGTAPSYRDNGDARYTSAGADIATLADRIRHLIAAGQLPAHPGIHKIRQTLGCGTDTARRVQAALGGGA
ncbi:hypothetical protein AB0D67_14495 [Streptosporangium sp. NPDC048047]|uniref:hypothetical protein n=1 Tax=Streptosporangium sp. NPDC048047 TaxID=3155748 RepID=UPI003448843E